MLAGLSHFGNNLREFNFNNRTLVELAFILIYSNEQLALVLLTYLSNDPKYMSLIISLFALIVLTTFSIHKISMESKINMLERELNTSNQHKIDAVNNYRDLKNKYLETMQKLEIISKSLYNPRSGRKTRGVI